MSRGLNIAFFGSSLVSAYWNGAATYYRGIIRTLHERGHRVTFYEPDAYERQKHRDIPDPDYARVVVYPGSGTDGVSRALAAAGSADVLVKASGVGVFDEFLEAAILDLRKRSMLAIYWDVDAPATLERVQRNPRDAFRPLIARYDLILTYGGGVPVVDAYAQLGARRCVPIYNALDPLTHHPVPPDPRFAADLGFLGNRLPDREARVESFFLAAARACPERRFLLGGSGWDSKPLPANVHYAGHVYTRDHNAFNCTPRAVLNVSRESVARFGFSPTARVFEAAGAGACLITDAWDGIELFLEPNKEVLVARDGAEVAEHLRALQPERAAALGQAALQRVLAEHTFKQRVEQLERLLSVSRPMAPSTTVVLKPRELNTFSRHFENLRNAEAAQARRAPGNAERSAAQPLSIVFLGLSITSSWGNGHATTYRRLMRALCERGHDVLFLERDVPWYADNRDLPKPPFGTTALYTSLDELKRLYGHRIREADLVIVGSYVPEGTALGEWVVSQARGVTAFYDLDTPITLARLEARDYEYLSRALVSKYQLYLSFTGGPTLERLERRYGATRALPLYCSVDPQVYVPLNTPRAWSMGYLGTYSTDRQPALDALLAQTARRLPMKRFVLAGSQYPVELSWPANVQRIEHLAPAEHARFYSSQRCALNVTRKDMLRAGWSPSVRLFEAACCGTPVITDAWAGLEEFFNPGSEILIGRNSDDIVQFLSDIPDALLRSIGAAARKRVLAEHTSAHRAAQLEGYALQAMAKVEKVATA